MVIKLQILIFMDLYQRHNIYGYADQLENVIRRWTREWRRARRQKLLSSAVRKFPVKTWTRGDPYETCGVCMEDFNEQDKVRVFPCSHGQLFP